LSIDVFDTVVEPRYLPGQMKKLKMRGTESIDKEIIQKLGQELQVDAVMVGSVLLYGQEEVSEKVEFSIFVTMLDVNTGDILWSGSTFLRSSTTWGEVFGLSNGPSINEMAVAGVIDLAGELEYIFDASREKENMLMLSDDDLSMDDEELLDDDDLFEDDDEEEEAEELLLKVKPK
jgi:hypothetical protein